MTEAQQTTGTGVTFDVPEDLVAILPTKASSETEWQAVLRLVIPRWLPLKLYRSIPGAKKVERGGWMHGMPVGASDLNGWVVGTGRRIEIECKRAGHPSTDEQERWIDAAIADGCIAFVARYDTADDMLTNLRRVADALVAAGVGA